MGISMVVGEDTNNGIPPTESEAAGLVSSPPADGYQARESGWEFPMGISMVDGEDTNNGMEDEYFVGRW